VVVGQRIEQIGPLRRLFRAVCSGPAGETRGIRMKDGANFVEVTMYQRILVPLDGSEHAESALSLACTLASMSDAEITLLRVVEYPSEVFSTAVYSRFYPNPLADPGLDEKMRAKKVAIKRRVKDYLEDLASSIETITPKVLIEIQDGPVVDAILSSIAKLEIDLVVMSTTGEDRNPWMMGAIANRILREAQVPVIFMREGSDDSVPDGSSLQRLSLQKVSYVNG
jgi:nucleotide-binding universal stress UspA family protein